MIDLDAPKAKPVATLQPSPRIIAFIKGFETCARPVAGRSGFFAAYMPTPKDRPTIGWGSTGPDVRMGMVWPQADCDARFARDLGDFAAGVRHDLGSAPTTQDQFDALLALTYNIGGANFAASTLLKDHRAGDFQSAADQFLRWDHQAGAVLPGLTRRRAAERSIYLGDH